MQIQRTRGNTAPDVFTVTNSKTGALVNLTGATFKLTINSLQAPLNSTTQMYQLTGVINNPTEGVVEFSPTALQANLVGIYYFEVQMTDTLGRTLALDSGTYTFVESITK